MAGSRVGLVGEAIADLVEQVRVSVVEVRPATGGYGAGTIWRADGLIVTNHHVAHVDVADVTLANGRTYPARVVSRDPDDDLAALQIAAAGLPAARLGDARSLRPGELVLAIGHPVGFRAAVSVGVVHRAPAFANGRRELIQADVLLGPGNSGGPLVDARGRVLGINAMVAGGLGLAVPSHLVERLLGIEERRALLGLTVQSVELPAHQAAARRALIVVGITPDSPAEGAGLLLGDVLLALDGRQLLSPADLGSAFDAASDVPHRLELLRAAAHREVTVPALRPRQKVA